MTLIVGIEHHGQVVIAADSGIWDDFAHTMASPKVFRRGPVLIGVAGNLKPRNLIEFAFEPPAYDPAAAAEAYLVRDFVPALTEVLRGGGCWKDGGDDHEGCPGLAMLVGISGGCYDLGSELAVSRVRRPFTAVGQSAGVGVALGHLAATAGFGVSPCDRAEAALSAAADLCDRVRGPWHVEMLPG